MNGAVAMTNFSDQQLHDISSVSLHAHPGLTFQTAPGGRRNYPWGPCAGAAAASRTGFADLRAVPRPFSQNDAVREGIKADVARIVRLP